MALLFSSVLIPVIVDEAYAKCMVGDDECHGSPIVPPLKFQFQYFALPDIICPNQDHALDERSNGKLACVTSGMAEKTGWHIHYMNVVDAKGQVHITSPGIISWIPFEITGATLDKMIYENQMLIVSVTPNDEYGILSVELPLGSVPVHFEYCGPNNENPFDTPFVMITDGQKYPLVEGVNSRGQSAVNISLDENSETIEIIRTCNDTSQKSSKISSDGKNPENCPLSFSSRCITGTVTEIFDGDTVRVGGALFRLALVSSPELDEEGGQEAKIFLEEICPIGSDALVDQDDLRPLEGLSGSSRIMATVYCDGLNLNEELVEFDFEYFDGMYCYTSEFADDPWAREGCSE